MKTIEHQTGQALTEMRALTTPIETSQGFSEKFADWLNFRTFNDPELVKLVAAAQEWAEALRAGKAPRWLSLIGGSGVGKTHVALKLWRWSLAFTQSGWSRTAYTAQKVYWPVFIQKLRAGNIYDLRSDMMMWPVLFLDDVGAERDPSGFAAEELNTLLGQRMGRWTLLTSNLSMERFAALDGRLASRLVRDRNICVGIKTLDYAQRSVQG